jgi:hypothetical protein
MNGKRSILKIILFDEKGHEMKYKNILMELVVIVLRIWILKKAQVQ